MHYHSVLGIVLFVEAMEGRQGFQLIERESQQNVVMPLVLLVALLFGDHKGNEAGGPDHAEGKVDTHSRREDRDKVVEVSDVCLVIHNYNLVEIKEYDCCSCFYIRLSDELAPILKSRQIAIILKQKEISDHMGSPCSGFSDNGRTVSSVHISAKGRSIPERNEE
jgi:hypothetical protein